MLDAIRSLIVWTPLGLPAFLFVITTVVFFHELGHFWVARRFGVKVEVFSVGFGGEIFGWTDRLGTRWKISWLPIGGYVKFAGDANASGGNIAVCWKPLSLHGPKTQNCSQNRAM